MDNALSGKIEFVDERLNLVIEYKAAGKQFFTRMLCREFEG